MTSTEALQVLKLMARPYNVSVDAELTDVWFNSALESCDYDTGLDIARQLIEHSRFMPKPAEFNEVKRAKSNRGSAALPESTWPPDPATKERIKAEMRQTLEALRGS